ncbi:MAG TPA: type II toxin-antitoxin system VapC family toxin [Candidatus Thiothrix moscowensis]|uniref:type II toxin-antitoxin system tRNA(fMet)-specific endonuclease VapC n=1 Tax=unclassified Thiothrix TaxID=2636184 RepID=UPI0025E5282F|nr:MULTISPECIES: type II toxin-antitoxin system VapC family toxin [unclassified Thiothrix]HRJ51560.1 type II toxin-antitoxin system VapC family toxin [Candidatus Thiothrix moscowensis]HRJ91875.1 type II toxin-antitoxin system VapC family toxin [Candidatus Thiothrix moscowensis]
MNYLLDTNICIYLIKRKPPEVLQRFRQLQPGSVFISSVTTSELYYGAQKSQRVQTNLEALNNFLLPFRIVDYDESATFLYGELRADLEKRGQPIGSLDMMIAAHALSLDVPLVTNNTKEFERVKGLKLDNWVG